MRQIQYATVEEMEASPSPEAPQYTSKAATVAELRREIRRQPGVPQFGPILYEAYEDGHRDWLDLAEASVVPEGDPLLLKMAESHSEEFHIPYDQLIEASRAH